MKSQNIYKDYSEFLKNKGYTEYTDSTFGGFFKKAPIIYKNAKYFDNKGNDFKFSYEINLKVKKPYILSVPFINTYDDSKIAGIVFVYSNQRVLSYIIEETSDSKNPSNNTADILLENNNMEIVNVNQIIGADSIIDWECARNCALSCALDMNCWSIPYPFNIPCFAACWGIYYDMCTIFGIGKP